MPSIVTERIWMIYKDNLMPRDGRIALESSQVIGSDADTLGPLHVTRGLRVADQAVFLEFKPRNKAEREELTARSVGYLVTHFEPPGMGILVSGELLDRDPGGWLTNRLIGSWEYLSREGYSPREFGLNALATYLSQRGIIKE